MILKYRHVRVCYAEVTLQESGGEQKSGLADPSSLLILSSIYYNCDEILSGAQNLKTDALEKYN